MTVEEQYCKPKAWTFKRDRGHMPAIIEMKMRAVSLSESMQIGQMVIVFLNLWLPTLSDIVLTS